MNPKVRASLEEAGWRFGDAADFLGETNLPPDKQVGPINEATPIGHCAIEAVCVHRLLDEQDVPREKDGKTLSLWGRVLVFKEL
jgi:hypothetical protein